MKKVLSVLVAVLLIAISALPAFAASVDSPKPTTANYDIKVVTDTDGGDYDFEYTSDVLDDGTQTVRFTAKPDPGYEFAGWTFEGDYDIISGDLNSTVIELSISSDIKAIPLFKKAGSDDKGTDGGKVIIDDGTKSPQTGDVAMFSIIAISALALAAAVVATKKVSKK